MTAALRLVRHYLLRRPHTPRHAKPEPLAPLTTSEDDWIPFRRNPYEETR